MFQQEDIHGKHQERLGQTQHSGEPLDELLPIVSADGRTIGHTFRSRVHALSKLILPKVCLWLTRPTGEVLLRRMGVSGVDGPLWDAAVEGTVRLGESVEMAAKRAWLRLGGVAPDAPLCFTERHLHLTEDRSELAYNFHVTLRPPTEITKMSEVDSGDFAFWSFDAIAGDLDSGKFSNAVVRNLAAVQRAFRFDEAI